MFGTGSAPRFNGKAIGYYVQQMNIPDDGSNRTNRMTAFREATSALQEMGPAAVRWLAQRIEPKESPWQKRYHSLWQASPPIIQEAMPAPRELLTDTCII